MNFSMPSKKRSTSSRSGALSSPRLQTRKPSRERNAQEMATMRCCSCGRKSLPESWRARACMALPTSSSDRPSRPNSRRPNSTSGTVSMSNTSVFIAASAGDVLPCRALAPGLARRRFEHGHGDDQPGLVGERDVPVADAELAAHLLAARRIDHFGPAPGVLHHAHVANPDAMREARAHGLDDGLLGGETHREKPFGSPRFAELRAFGRHQQAVDEMVAVLVVQPS